MTEKQRNGIIAGSVFGGMLVLFGLFTIIKYNKKMITKLVQWWKVEPTVEVMQSLNMKFSADDDVLKDDYFGYVKEDYFDNSSNNDVFDEGEPILPPANESPKAIARDQDNELSILHRLHESESQLSRLASDIAPVENNDIRSSLEWLPSDPHWSKSGEYCTTVQQKELKFDEEDEYSYGDPTDQYLSHKVREPTSDEIESENSSLNLQQDSIDEDVYTRRCTRIGTVDDNGEQLSASVDDILSISLRSINSIGGEMLANDTLYDTDTDSSGYIGGAENKHESMSIDCDNRSLLTDSSVEKDCRNNNNNDEYSDDNRFDSGIPSSLTSLQDEFVPPVQTDTGKVSLCEINQDSSINNTNSNDLHVDDEYGRTGYHAVRICDIGEPDLCQ